MRSHQMRDGTVKHEAFFDWSGAGISTQRHSNVYFVDPILEMIEGAKKIGTERIELYTEAFAHQYGLEIKMRFCHIHNQQF
jgi:pyridoxine 5-phosphate synthase